MNAIRLVYAAAIFALFAAHAPVARAQSVAEPITADFSLATEPSPGSGYCDDLSGQPINLNLGWGTVWQALSEESSCTDNCHNGSDPAAELDLGSLMLSIYFLVEQPSSRDLDAIRVVPGDPRASVFFLKVNCDKLPVGRRMPPGVHMPLELQGLIYDWIEQGAYGEGLEDPIPRDFLFRATMESLRR